MSPSGWRDKTRASANNSGFVIMPPVGLAAEEPVARCGRVTGRPAAARENGGRLISILLTFSYLRVSRGGGRAAAAGVLQRIRNERGPSDAEPSAGGRASQLRQAALRPVVRAGAAAGAGRRA